MSMNVAEQLGLVSCCLSDRKSLAQMSSIPVAFMRRIILFIGMLRLTVPKASLLNSQIIFICSKFKVPK